MRDNKASVVARGGLFTALGVLCVYLSSFLPANKIFLESIGSCLILVSIIITGMKSSMLVYSATAILSLLLCGLRLTTISYVIFFGLYAFIKHYIEGLNNLVVEYVLKLLYCNISLFALFLIYKLFLPSLLNFTVSVYIILIAAQVVFIVYDYALTLFISYFKNKFKKTY